MFILRKQENGKIPLLVEDNMKAPLYERLGRDVDSVRVFPFVVTSLEFTHEDLVFVCRYENHHLKDVLRNLDIAEEYKEWDGSEGYKIILHERKGRRIILILGNDSVNLASGLSYFIDNSVFSEEGWEYRGEAIEERPFFDYRVFWTWDRRIAWGDDGSIKAAKTIEDQNGEAVSSAAVFVDDYKRVIDFCQQNMINALVVWGFLRDSHGGIEAAQEICHYARKRGVRLLPGIGTSRYGGFYLSGDHPFSSDKWLERHPEYSLIDKNGKRAERLCPSHPENIIWLKEGTHWFLETFDVGGLNLEHGNYSACYCERCRERREKSADFDYYQDMVAANIHVIEEALREKDDLWVMYATYTGFNIGEPDIAPNGILRSPVSNMGSRVPDFTSLMPSSAICQWTITGMLNDPAVSMITLLDDGAPESILSAPLWSKGIRPPVMKNCGYFHQRKSVKGGPVISSIKEACLRGTIEGLQGLSIYGEISRRDVSQELNYLAFSHFLSHPKDSLREFAEARLSPLVGGSDLAQQYIEFLAKIEVGFFSDDDRKILSKVLKGFKKNVRAGKEWGAYHRWQWLAAYSVAKNGEIDLLNDT